MRWQVLIPLRASGAGKSRLRGATREPAAHEDLVRAIQRDAVEAVRSARLRGEGLPVQIGGIHLVTACAPRDWSYPDVEVIGDIGGGLNAALLAAVAQVAERWPDDGALAMVADLPALRPSDLLSVLARASAHPCGFVADVEGTGTTMLTARRALDLRPQFGPGSADRHRAAGYAPLAAEDGARSDVDTSEDLQRCLRLGVGEHTAAMLSHLHSDVQGA